MAVRRTAGLSWPAVRFGSFVTEPVSEQMHLPQRRHLCRSRPYYWCCEPSRRLLVTPSLSGCGVGVADECDGRPAVSGFSGSPGEDLALPVAAFLPDPSVVERPPATAAAVS